MRELKMIQILLIFSLAANIEAFPQTAFEGLHQTVNGGNGVVNTPGPGSHGVVHGHTNPRK